MQDFTRSKKNSSARITERQSLANNLKFSMKMFKRGKKEVPAPPPHRSNQQFLSGGDRRSWREVGFAELEMYIIV
jgi:hypothetical protein